MTASSKATPIKKEEYSTPTQISKTWAKAQNYSIDSRPQSQFSNVWQKPDNMTNDHPKGEESIATSQYHILGQKQKQEPYNSKKCPGTIETTHATISSEVLLPS